MKNKDKDKMSTSKVTAIRVKVLNDPSGSYEKIFRSFTGNNTASLMRPAFISFNFDVIELGFRDDLGDYKCISKLNFSEIMNAKYIPDAISVKNQMKKPMYRGLAVGVGIGLIILFRGITINSFTLLGIIAFTTLLWAIGGLLKVEKITIITLKSRDSNEMMFAANKRNLILITNLMRERNIYIENGNELKMNEPSLDLDTNVENAILTLKVLIDKEKSQGIFNKSHRNEILLNIQRYCDSKNNTINILNAYQSKFKSNLTQDLMSLSSNYDTKKELLQVFIKLKIVEDVYPHKLIEKI
jgi:hypothetical protein